MFTRKTQGRLAAVGGLRVTLIVFGVMWGWHVSAVKAQEVATGSSRVASASEIPSFQRHVAALLGKLGCNGGTCHGAVKGRNGFQLSMFSADPSGDHERITRESAGRRIDLIAASESVAAEGDRSSATRWRTATHRGLARLPVAPRLALRPRTAGRSTAIGAQAVVGRASLERHRAWRVFFSASFRRVCGWHY
jgi:hypothetical protein